VAYGYHSNDISNCYVFFKVQNVFDIKHGKYSNIATDFSLVPGPIRVYQLRSNRWMILSILIIAACVCWLMVQNKFVIVSVKLSFMHCHLLSLIE
jgi:hypothetical protein